MLIPLYDRVKDPCEIFELSNLELKVFEELKAMLTSFNVLKLPDFAKIFYITISYTATGYGATLL